MNGFLCLYNGQEAVAAGSASLLREHDHLVTHHRCHGYALASGMPMTGCMAELFGKATGCSKGKAGALRFFAPDKHFWGGYDVAGAQTPIGLGLAYAIKYRGTPGAALCVLGDGSANQGCFYESLNMAALFDLPVVYLIENNLYVIGSHVTRNSAFKTCLAQRAEGFNIAWAQCDGTDVYEVRAHVQDALERARRESKPTVLELSTYRFYGFSVTDARHRGGYRSEEEIRFHKENRDPITVFTKRLIAEGCLTETDLSTIEEAAETEAAEAVKFADESPFPTEAAFTENIYYEVDHGTPAGRTGRHFFTPEGLPNVTRKSAD